MKDISGSPQSETLKTHRVRFSVEADKRLRMLKARTGITPNLLCRLAFCLSVSESGDPVSDDSELSNREINRYTLLGEYDRLFVSLLKLRHADAADDAHALTSLLSQHMHRGIAFLNNRVKSPAAVLELVVSVAAKEKRAKARSSGS